MNNQIELQPHYDKGYYVPGGCKYSPVIIILCQRKTFYYYSGNRPKLYNEVYEAFEKAERFIRLFNKFQEAKP